jgi:hypothetical protein
MPSARPFVTPANPLDGPQGPAARGGVQACPWQGTGGKQLKSMDSRLRGNDEISDVALIPSEQADHPILVAADR